MERLVVGQLHLESPPRCCLGGLSCIVEGGLALRENISLALPLISKKKGSLCHENSGSPIRTTPRRSMSKLMARGWLRNELADIKTLRKPTACSA